MAEAILAPSNTWFAPTVADVTRTSITEIYIVDSYTPTGTVTDSWDASAAKDGSIMVYVEGAKLTIAGNGSGKIYANEDSSKLFYGSSSDKFDSATIIDGLALIDTSRATTMYATFAYCSSVATLDVGNWDTSNVTNMASMFRECYALSALDVSKWDVSKVTTFKSTFCGGNYGTTQMSITELDVSKWDTSSCTDMGWMFYGQNGLETLDVSNWDVSKVTSFHHMFAHAGKLVLNDVVTNWDVSSCRHFTAMFHGNDNTLLDLSKWNVSNGLSFSQMFERNVCLTEIKGLNKWNTSNCKSFVQMFAGCQALKSLDLSGFDTRNANEAWIDDQRDAPGGGMAQMLGHVSNKEDGTIENWNWMRSLQEVHLGPNFSFDGDGTCAPAVLWPPSSQHVFGVGDDPYSGSWYNINGEGFSYISVPNRTEGVYYPTISLIKNVHVLVKNETLLSLADAVRGATGRTETFTPSGLVNALNDAELSAWGTFWDDFQDKGQRVDYKYAFAGRFWGKDTFYPKYDMRPTNMEAIFSNNTMENAYDLASRLDELGIVLDTSNCTNFLMLSAYGGPSRWPVLDLRSAKNQSTIFRYAQVLTIDKIILRDAGDTDLRYAFESCGALKSITFEGCIGSCSMSFQWSKKLTNDSMKSIITHLADYSGTENDQQYTLKFDNTCWDNLNAEGATSPNGNTWREYVNDLGWLT